MQAWEQHIAGAAALLRLRGKEQLQTELGLRLFKSIRNLLVCNLSDLAMASHLMCS